MSDAGAPFEIGPELQAEFDAWERAGEEAWALINRWEQEEKPESPDKPA